MGAAAGGGGSVVAPDGANKADQILTNRPKTSIFSLLKASKLIARNLANSTSKAKIPRCDRTTTPGGQFGMVESVNSLIKDKVALIKKSQHLN